MSPGTAVPAAAIVGLGLTEIGKVFGRSPRRLAAEAVRRAAYDAGLAVGDLDGLLVCPGMSGGLDIGLAATMGLRDLSLLAEISSYGASAGAAVQYAALAVGSGAATAVACVFADTPLRPAAPAGSAFGGGKPGQNGGQNDGRNDGRNDGKGGGPGRQERPTEWPGLAGLRAAQGFRSVTAYYALAAQRHMATYGTTSEQFGAVAVAQRQWAAGNPRAQLREPITLADHQSSRWIVEPLHLLDCCLVSNGAIAVVITTAGRARALRHPPVHIWGWGQGHPRQPMERGSGFGLVTGAAISGPAAMRMAGITARDVTMCQLYDCYTYTVVVSLEDYGLCAKGEGGPFAASGALAPGGSLPCNTGGGQLSAYYMWGFSPLSEAVIQARGAGGERQADANDVILVSGNGGILAHHSTLILSPHARQDRAQASAV
ncbi:MAG: thiolase family protein [Micromonosporaceae bacterium]